MTNAIGQDGSLTSGMATGAHALRSAQEQFASASSEVALQGAALSGAALPEAGPARAQAARASSSNLAGAVIDQKLAARSLQLNAKVLRAFDDMLSEVLQTVSGRR